MASGGAAGFLEEWKAKREKMRAKSLSESGVGTGGAPGQPARNGTDGGAETSVTAGDRGSTNRGATGRPGERKAEDESRGQAPICGSSRDVEPRVCTTGASTSPQTSSPSPGSRERKTMGASARKAKGKMEKRKMREKRRSTGVVNLSAQEVSVCSSIFTHYSVCPLSIVHPFVTKCLSSCFALFITTGVYRPLAKETKKIPRRLIRVYGTFYGPDVTMPSLRHRSQTINFARPWL